MYDRSLWPAVGDVQHKGGELVV